MKTMTIVGMLVLVAVGFWAGCEPVSLDQLPFEDPGAVLDDSGRSLPAVEVKAGDPVIITANRTAVLPGNRIDGRDMVQLTAAFPSTIDCSSLVWEIGSVVNANGDELPDIAGFGRFQDTNGNVLSAATVGQGGSVWFKVAQLDKELFRVAGASELTALKIRFVLILPDAGAGETARTAGEVIASREIVIQPPPIQPLNASYSYKIFNSQGIEVSSVEPGSTVKVTIVVNDGQPAYRVDWKLEKGIGALSELPADPYVKTDRGTTSAVWTAPTHEQIKEQTRLDRANSVALRYPRGSTLENIQVKITDAASAAITRDIPIDLKIDGILPTAEVEREAGQEKLTNGTPITFIAKFSEPVTGFSQVKIAGTAGVQTGDVTITPQSPNSDGSSADYVITIAKLANDGTVEASVEAGAALDDVGNLSVASTGVENWVIYDTTPPSVTLDQPGTQADPNNASEISYIVQFSDPVMGFNKSCISLEGTALPSAVAVTEIGSKDQTSFQVVVTGMSQDGTVVATIPAGVVTDLAGNGNTASTSIDNVVVHDVTRPLVTVNQSSAQSDPTNADEISFTVVFSEPVAGFSADGVLLGGTARPNRAVVTEVQPNNQTTYNVVVDGMMPDGGTVVLNVAALAAQDAAGNKSTASTSTDNSVIFDTTPPTVTINQNGGQVDPTNGTSIVFKVVFSELVSDFDPTDILVGGTANATAVVVDEVVAGKEYLVSVSGMSNQGTVIASVKGGAAEDAAGNATLASTSTDNTVNYDATPPTVVVEQAVAQADPTNIASIEFAVTFSEPVQDFSEDDVSIGGTAVPATKGITELPPYNATTYRLLVGGMKNDGTVTAGIPAGGARDQAGNINLLSTSLDAEVTFDKTAPTVTVEQATGQADPTNSSTIYFTVMFSDPVNDFDSSDVMVIGTAGATTPVVTEIAPNNGTTFDVAVSGASADGTVVIIVPGSSAHDDAGNPNFASSSTDNVVTRDTMAPGATVNRLESQLDPTNTSPVRFVVAFTEPVVGFDNAGVSLSGSALPTSAIVTKTSNTTYEVAVDGMAGSGIVVAAVAAGAVTDPAGNPNIASTSTDNEVAYDVTAPTVTINQAGGQTDPTNGLINFTAVFSEPVSGFGDSSFDLTLGGTANPTTVVITEMAPFNGTSFNVAVGGQASNGTVTVSIAAGAARDAAGNASLASTSIDNEVTYDTVPPSVTVNQASLQADPTNASTINFTVVFSEPARNFATGDVNLLGTAGATTAVVAQTAPFDGTTYSVVVSGMTASGSVVVSIPPAVAADDAGNLNAASSSTDNSVSYDATSPAVTINQAAAQADPTNAAPVHFVAVFTEPVTGFDSADIVLGGTAGATTAVVTQIAPNNGTTYDVAVSGMTPSGSVNASVLVAAAADVAGNLSTASNSVDNSITYDVTAPTVAINQAEGQADPTNKPVTFTIVFNEPVIGFDDTDVLLSGAANPSIVVVTELAPLNRTRYRAEVSGMADDGMVVASIGSGAVADDAGNINAASTSTDNAVEYNTTAPTVTIEQAPTQADPSKGSPVHFRVTFSEPVFGFGVGDVGLLGTAGASTAAVAQIAPNDNTVYEISVSGMVSAGSVVAVIPPGVAADAAGNVNVASTSTDNLVVYDNVPPTLLVAQTVPGANSTVNADSLAQIQVVFSEVVTGVTAAALTVEGSAATSVQVSGNTYTFSGYAMPSEGAVTVGLGAVGIYDPAGNAFGGQTWAYTKDDGAPTRWSAVPADGETINTLSMIRVTFSKPVRGAAAANLTITDGVVTTAATKVDPKQGLNQTYEFSGFNVASLKQGVITVQLAAGSIKDAANNPFAGSDWTYVKDTVGPSATITKLSSDPTNASTVAYQIDWSEDLIGFQMGDLVLAGTAPGKSLAEFQQVNAHQFSVKVVGISGSGSVRLSIGSGAATDAVGNASTASAVSQYDIDKVAPTISGVQVLTGSTVQVTFSESLVAAGAETAANYVLSGAGKGTLATSPATAVLSDNVATLTWNSGEMKINEDITVTVSNVADEAGNLIGSPNSGTHAGGGIGIRPVVLSVEAITSSKVQVVFNEPLVTAGAQIAANYVLTGTGKGTLASNPATAVLSGNIVTLTWASGKMKNGEITITVSNVSDLVANVIGSQNAGTCTTIVVPPTVSGVQVLSDTQVRVTFSESLMTAGAQIAANYALGGTGKGTLAANPATVVLSGNVATLTWLSGEMKSGGDITITVSNVTDLAGNVIGSPNIGTHVGGGIGAQPTVSSVQVLSGTQVRVSFSESLVTAGAQAAANYVLTGTGKGTLATNPATAVLFGNVATLTWLSGEMKSGGDITITVNNVTDLAGNTIGVLNNGTHVGGAIGTSPSVVINQAATQDDPATAIPIRFTVVFSEPVIGFTSAGVDLIVTPADPGAIVSVTGSGATYTVFVEGLTISGTIEANVVAGAAADLAGNLNSASTSTDNQVSLP